MTGHSCLGTTAWLDWYAVRIALNELRGKVGR